MLKSNLVIYKMEEILGHVINDVRMVHYGFTRPIDISLLKFKNGLKIDIIGFIYI